MKSLLLLALALILTGCARFSYTGSGQFLKNDYTQAVNAPAPENLVYFTYRVEGRNAILDSEKLKLIFPGIPASKRGIFRLDNVSFHDGFPVQIGGEGVHEGNVSCRRNFSEATLWVRYEKGTTTIRFCDREVKLIDHARVAVVNDERFEVSDIKVVRVAARNKNG